MEYAIDRDYLVKTTKRLVECDSPVGYYADVEPLMRELVGECGYEMTWDRKHTGYVRIEGKSHERCVCMGAHLDTVGFVVRGFNVDLSGTSGVLPGTLRVRQLGGISYPSAEGATCRIHCRNGNVVNAELIENKHSVHVFEDSKTDPRDENHMSLSVIGDVRSIDDVRALGVTQGAIVSVDPQFEYFDNGYIVSRHIDDKACVAVLLAMLRWLHETGQKPAYDTLLAFPIYEEIGHGGTYVPSDVSEYVALDIALIGPDYDTDEHSVGIIAADIKGPYDWDLTNRLIHAAEQSCEAGSWSTQVAFHFSTDAMAAFIHGANVYAGAFGPACLNTHGRERCHVDALVETERLAIAYAMGRGE